MSGRIRLGCMCCSREDFEGIDRLPDDWEDIDEVQTYEESIRAIDPDDPDGDVTSWETHIGICPDCREETARVRPDRGERCGRCDQLLKTTHVTEKRGGMTYCSATCNELAADGT